jgi:AcrR family transcriptional regulator
MARQGPAVKRKSAPRVDPKEALLAAAEIIVREEGYPLVTTRRLASRAGVNQALVHYHFGSIDDLLLKMLHRVWSDLANQMPDDRESDDPYEFWRAVLTETIPDGLASGASKVWLETIAMALNRPDAQAPIAEHFKVVNGLFVEQAAATLADVGVADESGELARQFAAVAHAVADGLLLQRLMSYDTGWEVIRQLLDSRSAEHAEAGGSS